MTVAHTGASFFLLAAWMFCCGGWDRYVMPLFNDDGQAELDAEIDEQAMSVFEGAIKRSQKKKAAGGEDGANSKGGFLGSMLGAGKPTPKQTAKASSKKQD